MLARSALPADYNDWNRRVGAPFGKSIPLAKKLKRLLPSKWYWRLRGPFSVQKNNTTRAFEYPFVINQIKDVKGKSILDIGGGLSGLQFVLSRLGGRVVNVDPGMEAAGKGWPCDQQSMTKLNTLFGTDVILRNTTVDKASLPNESFDVALSVSVIEHLPWVEVKTVMDKVWDALKPGGIFILTVDLFLDVFPFTATKENKYGANINIHDMVRSKPFDLVYGEKSELFGFPEFQKDTVLMHKYDYLIGQGYPAMVQCLVLRKPRDTQAQNEEQKKSA